MSSNGLRYLSKALLGFDELEWQEDEHNERAAWFRSQGAHEAGWLIERVGAALNGGWDIKSTSGVLSVRTTISSVPELVDQCRPNTSRPFLGVDRDGNVLEIWPGATLLDASGDPITVPNDGVWYTLIARYATTQKEPGTLSLVGGSTTITGVGTNFLRYTAGGSRPTILRIDAADTVNGNEGTYRVATVTDEVTATLDTAPPSSESGVPFRVSGRFFSGIPADPDIHANSTIAWELVARTTTRPTDALIAFDVKRTAGVFAKIDRRRGSLFRPIVPSNKCIGLTPITQINLNSGASDFKQCVPVIDHPNLILSASGSSALAMSMCPAATGSQATGLAADQPTGMMLASLYNNGSTKKINVLVYTQVRDDGLQWSNPDGTVTSSPPSGSTVDIVSGAGITDVAVVNLPSDSGNTHAAFYCDASGTVQMKRSTDNGATWSSATAIWNPAGADTVTKVAAVFTRLGRLIVVGLYSTGTNRMRWVVSDDIGDSWDNNSQAGFDLGGGSTVVDLAAAEDDRGNFWTITAENGGGANGLRMYRGAGEGNPTPDTDEEPPAWKVGPEVTVDFVDCFALPHGMLGVFASETASSAKGWIRFLVLTRQQTPYQRPLIKDANDVYDHTVPIACGVSGAGVVFLALQNTNTSSHHVTTSILQFSPVYSERSMQWFGG
jgi:hypothetical protein